MPSNDDIFRLASERFDYASSTDKEERYQADIDNRFAINYEGAQWPAAVRAVRESDTPPRPCLSINKIPEKIDQVQGEFEQLQPAIKIRGVDSQADPKIAEIYAGIIRHIEYNSNARNAYNTSHSSTLHCGRGAWRIDIEDNKDDPFTRDIVINRIPNVFNVYWDPSAKKQDKSDGNFWFITEELTEKEYEAEYGKDAPKIEFNSDDTWIWSKWRTEKTFRVGEYWWKEKEKETFFQVQRGQDVVTIKEADFNPETDVFIDKRLVKVPRVKWCKMVAGHILDGPNDWPSKYIPIILETGKEVNVGGHSKTRGMVRFGRTPQELYNYYVSSNTELTALIPKNPYIMTAKMLGQHQGQWDNANIKNYMYLLYNVDEKNPTARPYREPPPQLSTAHAYLMERMEHDIMSGMGIYQASLGDEGTEKSGRAILAKQRQGNIGTYTYTSNFQVSLTYSGKVIIDLIPYVYDTERIIRIRGTDDTEKVIPINARPNSQIINMVREQGLKDTFIAEPRDGITQYINDLGVGKYDIVVTIGPSYTTQRQEALEMMIELAAKVPQFAVAAIDLIVKNMDVPGSEELYERAKKLIPPNLRDPEPGEEQQQEEPPPDPMVVIKMQELELKKQESARKDFEAKIEAIAKLAKAEAEEQGQQLQKLNAFMEEIRSSMNQPTQGA